jgi:hypothetical protein
MRGLGTKKRDEMNEAVEIYVRARIFTDISGRAEFFETANIPTYLLEARS